MKTFGTLALVGTGALLFYAIATLGLGPTFAVLLVAAYCLAIFTGICFLITFFAGFVNNPDADRIWALAPALPFWSTAKLIYYTGRYWFEVFAITNWDYHAGKIEEDYLLREAEAEFYNKALVLNFKPWCSL
ncbi:hypothetical protein [Taklimakanibacter albus]|uniref:Uncharacterized protein n=1 Tax=Taklimakanibacter albus TaxID=2800327 RepID=A0ACC5RFR3_9HYPH|nr:hypothetical protein [Aestuariivirga sp. YIM B02566]MBK1871559.1 hypothetical protein [Aestuariivirga sp. YIM B02566]